MKIRAWLIELALLGIAPLGCTLFKYQTSQNIEPTFAIAARYQFGKDRTPLTIIENRVLLATNNADQSVDSDRHFLERQLTCLATNQAATVDARQWACRQLELIATPASVQPLIKLLGEPALLESALATLQRIPDKSIDRHLLKLLWRTRNRAHNEQLRIGLINMLAERRNPQIITAVKHDLVAGNPYLMQAAANALGQLGTAEAAHQLYKAQFRRPEPLPGDLRPYAGARAAATPFIRRQSLEENLLRCADHLRQENSTLATEIYKRVYETNNGGLIAVEKTTLSLNLEPVRVAALRGCAISDSAAALPYLMSALIKYENGDTTQAKRLRLAAAQIAQEIPGNELTKSIASYLKLSRSDNRILLVNILAARHDPIAAPAVRDVLNQSLREKDPPGILASINCLRQWPNKPNTQALLNAAAETEGPARDAARVALREAGSAEAQHILIEMVRASSTTHRIEALRALAAYANAESRSVASSVLTDHEPLIRKAAASVMAEIADFEQQAHLLAIYPTVSLEERNLLEQAILTASQNEPEKGKRARPIIAALASAPDPKLRAGYLRLLGRLGGAEAMDLLASELSSSNFTARETALRALGTGTDSNALFLLEKFLINSNQDEHIMKKSKNVHAARAGLSSLALQLYLQKTWQQLAVDPATITLDRLRLAAKLSPTPEQEHMIVGLAGWVPDLRSFDFLLRYVNHADTSDAAVLALVNLARLFSLTSPPDARLALESIPSSAARLETTKETVLAVKTFLKRQDDYLLFWEIAGPFALTGRTFKGPILETVFPPENNPENPDYWRPLTIGIDEKNPPVVDLSSLIPGNPAAITYMRCSVYLPQAQPACLLLGNDDGIAAWLNDSKVGAFDEQHPVQPDEHAIAINLQQGWNRLMLKVTNISGKWAFTARLRSADGTIPGKPLTSLKIKAGW